MARVKQALIEVGQSAAVNQVQLVVLIIAGLSTVDEQVTVKDALSMVRAQKADEKVDVRRDLVTVDLVTVDLVTVDLVTVDLVTMDLVTVDLAVNRVIARVLLVEKVGLFDQKAKANRIDVKLL
jgi:hypothetical protein